MTPLTESLAAARPLQLEALKEWLRIPIISTLPEHQGDVRAAAQ
jgi:hypothetical protein